MCVSASRPHLRDSAGSPGDVSQRIISLSSQYVAVSCLPCSHYCYHCKTLIFRVHLIFTNFASSIKSWN